MHHERDASRGWVLGMTNTASQAGLWLGLSQVYNISLVLLPTLDIFLVNKGLQQVFL